MEGTLLLGDINYNNIIIMVWACIYAYFNNLNFAQLIIIMLSQLQYHNKKHITLLCIALGEIEYSNLII